MAPSLLCEGDWAPRRISIVRQENMDIFINVLVYVLCVIGAFLAGQRRDSRLNSKMNYPTITRSEMNLSQ